MVTNNDTSYNMAPSYTAVLVDADYLDYVAFDLTVNFERMIGRRIPQADLCLWLNCIALDGGLRQGGDELVQASFLHAAGKTELANFTPSRYDKELGGMAFKDGIAEFTLNSYAVEEVVSQADFFVQSLESLAAAGEVKRILVVGDMQAYGERIKNCCAELKTNGVQKDITLFTMEPVTGRGFQQEILGYSLMAALGIRSEELKG